MEIVGYVIYNVDAQAYYRGCGDFVKDLRRALIYENTVYITSYIIPKMLHDYPELEDCTLMTKKIMIKVVDDDEG